MKTKLLNRSLEWWARCVVHNAIAHPLLPLAELLEAAGFESAPQALYRLHDRTVPTGH